MRIGLEGLRRDFASAYHALRRTPRFAVVAIATFALGIGANAATFGVINGLLLRPPAHVAAPERLFTVEVLYHRDGQTFTSGTLAYPFFGALRADTATFAGVAAVTFPRRYTLGRGRDAEQVSTSLVSGNYFSVLGVRPAFGRVELADDEPVAVLSYGYWQRRFGGSPDVLGRVLHIASGYFTVVGVTPSFFNGVRPNVVDVWVPVGSAEGMRVGGTEWATEWSIYWINVLARPRAGVSLAEAGARALATLRAASPDRPGPGTREVVLRSVLSTEQAEALPQGRLAWLLGGVSLLVLLIACANIANLLVVRTVERRREIGVRLALGASRWRLVRLLLVETMLLAAAGGAVALLAAWWGGSLLRATLLDDFVWPDAPLNGVVVAATIALALGSMLLAGLWPALGAGRGDLTSALKAGAVWGSRERARTRAALLALQAALAVTLLVVAGAFVRSLQRVTALRLGFDTDRVLVARMDVGAVGYETPNAEALYREMAERVRAVPGVLRATVVGSHPLGQWSYGIFVTKPGPDSAPPPGAETYHVPVGADYFATLGTRIVRGRPITAEDVQTNARVVVVSEEFARAYWPGANAVGQCVYLGGEHPCDTVIGVAEETRADPRPESKRLLIYTPLSRMPVAWHELLIRVSVDPASVVPAIRRVMATAAPDLPYAEVGEIGALMRDHLRPWQVGAPLAGTFALLAALVATLGVYSVVSFGVAQRRFEIGVRIAVGARHADVLRLVVRDGLLSLAGGIALGTVGALAAGRLVEPLLFDTSPREPTVFATVVTIVLAAGSLASLLPARRAARVDPANVLKHD